MATLSDVAKHAGVSTATVSRVINGSGTVHPDTRERVEKAVAHLGYEPDRVARRLRGRDRPAALIGLLIPDLMNPFFSELARGVEDVAFRHGYAVIVCNSDENPEKEAFYLRVLRLEHVDGVILPMSSDNPELVAQISASKIPIVHVDRQPEHSPFPSVSVDNRCAAHDATEYLIQNGHTDIGMISGLHGLSTTVEREEGYRRALAEAGLHVREELIEAGHSSLEGGKTATQHLLKLDIPPTALFCGNNLMTLGALTALREAKVSIPGEISIVGFDDLPWAVSYDPPITVIKQPAYQMGTLAAELLFGPPHSASDVVLAHELIERGSVMQPRVCTNS